MRRRKFLALVIGTAALVPAAGAQQPPAPIVGVIVAGTPDPEPALRLFRQGLHELGYVEGRNIVLDIRSSNGDAERLPEIAAGLVRAKVDIIAAWLTPAVLAAKHATSTIPIVMIGAADPVGVGLVASLARPGGNVTGMAGQTGELAGKHIELLKETLPQLKRVAALCNAPDPFSRRFLAQIERAGAAQAIAVEPFMVASGEQLDRAFQAMRIDKIGAVIVQPSLPLQRAADLALRYKIPAVSPLAPFAQAGGLFAYAVAGELSRRAAVFVDKILKGAKPSDLPVEQPTLFQLTINLRTAKALGLTVPPVLLTRADTLIE